MTGAEIKATALGAAFIARAEGGRIGNAPHHHGRGPARDGQAGPEAAAAVAAGERMSGATQRAAQSAPQPARRVASCRRSGSTGWCWTSPVWTRAMPAPCAWHCRRIGEIRASGAQGSSPCPWPRKRSACRPGDPHRRRADGAPGRCRSIQNLSRCAGEVEGRQHEVRASRRHTAASCLRKKGVRASAIPSPAMLAHR